MAYIKQVAIAVDQLLNALLGGWADETFSARCWRLESERKWARVMRPVVDAIFFFDDNHCKESYESEMNRIQLAPEYRNR